MTSLRKHEERRNEKEMDVEGTEVRVVRGTGCSCIEFCGDESLELVDAGPIWATSNQLLASSRPLGSKQAPFRRIPRAAGAAHALAAPHDAAMGTDDTRRAGKVPRRDERPLRTVRIANGRAEGLSPCE